ncbi:hypothetical protein D3C84_528680 [compost metagenome]
MLPQLGINVRDSPFGKIVHVQDKAEAGVAEIKPLNTHNGRAKQLSRDFVTCVD